MEANYKHLEWDSKFFGRDVFRCDVEDQTTQLDRVVFPERALIYVYSDHLLDTKFQLVDKKITYASPVSNIKVDLSSSNSFIERFRDGDIQSLVELSIISSGFSRFRVDKSIGSDKVDELYRLWIQRAINNTQDFLIQVGRLNGEVTGMNVLKKTDFGFSIDLISVFDKFQGQGIGKHLIRAAAEEAASHGAKQIEVTTQLDNRPACTLYEKMGFVQKSLSYIYHIHT